MKPTEFQKDFTLDRSAKSLRAIAKHEPAQFPIALTGDGKPFDHTAIYHFYDGQAVRSTQGLRRVDVGNIGSLGLKIAKISTLRANKDDALTDAQKILIEKIRKLKEQVSECETQKTTKARSIKMILMASE